MRQDNREKIQEVIDALKDLRDDIYKYDFDENAVLNIGRAVESLKRAKGQDMVTRNYGDYTIQVHKQSDACGEGFLAWFFVKKDNGLKENTQWYKTYRRKTFRDVFDDVKKIIDALG